MPEKRQESGLNRTKQRNSVKTVLDKAGAKTHEVGPEQLWRMVDQDADGKLDYPEFEKLYGVMKTQGSLADDREDELVTKTRNMRRTMKYMLWAITGLVLFLSASVAANFGVIFAVVDGAKDTQVGGSTNNMQDRAGNLVAVAEAQVAVPLYALPALENDAVHQIKSMQVTD